MILSTMESKNKLLSLSSTQIELLRDIDKHGVGKGRKRARFDTVEKLKKLELIEFKNVNVKIEGKMFTGGKYFLTELGKQQIK